MKARPRTGTESGGASNEMRARILDAALRCITRWGFAKTGLLDVAEEAGCSRQTVYNHFPNAEAVIYAALYESSLAFVARLRTEIRAHDEPGERIVEAVLFCLRALPQEPVLLLIAEPGFAPLANRSLFRAAPTWDLLRSIAAECLAPSRSLASRTDELAEMMTRVLLSMLTLDAPHERSEAERRALLERWLLPPLGLEPPRRGRAGRGPVTARRTPSPARARRRSA